MAAGSGDDRFVTDSINQFDVVIGRGSGPYDQLGNIHFRDLVARRKLEYLSLKPRDSKMKNKIAQEIVDAVRSKGGRFLKKISVDNQRNGDVYELVDDERTVLEKAKQALRQNRSNFIKTTTWESNMGGPPASDTLQQEDEASMTASSAPTKPTISFPRPLPPRPALPTLDHCDGGGSVSNGGASLLGFNFNGITGPPPDPTTPEEWEAFHAYWSDENESNRKLWGQLQAQQQLLVEHQQRHLQRQQENCRQQYQQHQEQLRQQQQQQQIYQISNHAASSQNYSTEQDLWGQMQRQQKQVLRCMPSTSTPSQSFPEHGVGAAVPGIGGESHMTSQDSFQSQLYLLNYLPLQQNCFANGVSNQENNYSNQYQGHQQQQTFPIASASAVAPKDNTTDMNTAYLNYMAQLERNIISEDNRFQGEQGNSAHYSSSYMPSGREFDELEAGHLPVASSVSIMTVATKGHERNHSFGLKSAGGAHDDDHDSFFAGIKDMSLPSISIGDISDFGKHSCTTKSVILKEVIEDASERFDIQDMIQEVFAKVPSPTQECAIEPSLTKSKTNGNKRRSLSSYYREVNAAIAATHGRRCIGELDTDEANNDTMDIMSFSLQSMSLASKSSSDGSAPICQGSA